MNYLLDTDICVYWLKGNEKVEQRVLAIGLNDVAISFVTMSELYYGAYKSQRSKENLVAVRKLSEKLIIFESSDVVSDIFGRLKATLESEGKVIDDADLFIAASAIANDSTLVTNFAHKDCYNIKGQCKKINLCLDYEHALSLADDDINDNWEMYKEKFLRGEYP